MKWYVPRSRTRLTRPLLECPEQVTHQESLCHSFDRHNVLWHDDTLERLQRIASASETTIRSPEHIVPGLLSTLMYIFAELKNVIKNMSCGRSRDDVLCM